MSQIFESLLPEDMVPVSRGASPGEMTWQTVVASFDAAGSAAAAEAASGPATSLYLPGSTTDLVTLPSSPDLNIVDAPRTFIFELAVTSALNDGSIHTIFNKLGVSGQRCYDAYINAGTLQFRVSTDGGGTLLALVNYAAPAALTPNVFHELKIIYDPSNATASGQGTMDVFVDGVQVGGRSVGAGLTGFDGTDALFVGGASVGSNVNVPMWIKRFRVLDENGDTLADYRHDTNTGERYRDLVGKTWTTTGSAWATAVTDANPT
jgi:hypothetical protein